MSYAAADDRYSVQPYRRCGRSGLQLPAISLGFWHNFGDDKPLETQRAVMRRAFDLGVTHFDLANNYGPPYGSAETNVGRILAEDFAGYRDELVISTKAGWDMWPGPYGDLGSRKYLTASLDASLRRLGLDYVDIFYHHRPDPETPLEETMGALDAAVRAGKALYVGVSSYSPEPNGPGRGDPSRAGHPAADPPAVVLDVQPLDRARAARRAGAGRRRLHRLHRPGPGPAHRPLPGRRARRLARRPGQVTRRRSSIEANLDKIRALNEIAAGRGQTLAQLALAWVLRDSRVTSTLIGASSVQQLEDNVAAARRLDFTPDELAEIDRHAVESGVDLWAGARQAAG